MRFTRREFMRGGVAAVTFTFAAPRFMCELAAVPGYARNLVVLDLTGGNDSLSMLIPYTDSFYYSRRPTIAVPAASVLPIGSDSSGKPIGLHPRLTGLKSIYDAGRLAFIQRTGYANSSRSHFLGTDIWSTANPANSQGPGWVGKYLDTLLAPVDPLAGWCTTGQLPHSLVANTVPVPTIPSPSGYAFASPNGGAEAAAERAATSRVASHLPVNQPVVSFVCGSALAALETLDRVASVATYVPAFAYPNTGFGQALKAIAGTISRGIGTRAFWVQTGGFDTHSSQRVNETNGAYFNLMRTLDDGLLAFYNDLTLQGVLDQTLVLQFSEFGRRISENGSGGTDHGAASVMMAIGGPVRGGLYGTAPSLSPDPKNPTLENNAGDVRYETDFRSVYAAVIDNWLGADSVSLLGADFRNPALDFVQPLARL